MIRAERGARSPQRDTVSPDSGEQRLSQGHLLPAAASVFWGHWCLSLASEYVINLVHFVTSAQGLFTVSPHLLAGIHIHVGTWAAGAAADVPCTTHSKGPSAAPPCYLHGLPATIYLLLFLSANSEFS